MKHPPGAVKRARARTSARDRLPREGGLEVRRGGPLRAPPGSPGGRAASRRGASRGRASTAPRATPGGPAEPHHGAGLAVRHPGGADPGRPAFPAAVILRTVANGSALLDAGASGARGEHLDPPIDPVVAISRRARGDVQVHMGYVLPCRGTVVHEQIVTVRSQGLDHNPRPAVREDRPFPSAPHPRFALPHSCNREPWAPSTGSVLGIGTRSMLRSAAGRSSFMPYIMS
jgi:hypothetical protein